MVAMIEMVVKRGWHCGWEYDGGVIDSRIDMPVKRGRSGVGYGSIGGGKEGATAATVATVGKRRKRRYRDRQIYTTYL